MEALIEFLQKHIVTLASVLTAVGAIWKFCGVPIQSMIKKIDRLDEDTGDLIWDRLSQAHRFFLERGWASDEDKQRVCAMYERYKAKGRNHLAESFTRDILELPMSPPTIEKGDDET